MKGPPRRSLGTAASPLIIGSTTVVQLLSMHYQLLRLASYNTTSAAAAQVLLILCVPTAGVSDTMCVLTAVVFEPGG